ncbi:hypothetical protein KC19_3G251300 [Ceratodon purpureus]|uniref:Uncharacterized protein n=1 Tax=Ceratodon purpureus TaxID=3225 RepID=A0A8T0IPT4_CERPU|nr:hypothetical protein KC19_3G251300 [Ceratodon purpureus]
MLQYNGVSRAESPGQKEEQLDEELLSEHSKTLRQSEFVSALSILYMSQSPEIPPSGELSLVQDWTDYRHEGAACIRQR